MLAPTRRKGRSILIGGDVVVTVIAIRGNRVRLGTKAPKELAIRRVDAVPFGQNGRRPRLLATVFS
jgi:carbon storage regulator